MEQATNRNVIFIMDDTQLYVDIKFDAKWTYFDWQDEIKGYMTEQEVLKEMDKFRRY